jgi:hypothetical protein
MILRTFWGTYWEPLKNLIGKHNDTFPYSLKDSNVNPKMEIIGGGVRVHSLVRSSSKVEQRVTALG